MCKNCGSGYIYITKVKIVCRRCGYVEKRENGGCNRCLVYCYYYGVEKNAYGNKTIYNKTGCGYQPSFKL